jgi:hypothetical protein
MQMHMLECFGMFVLIDGTFITLVLEHDIVHFALGSRRLSLPNTTRLLLLSKCQIPFTLFHERIIYFPFVKSTTKPEVSLVALPFA